MKWMKSQVTIGLILMKYTGKCDHLSGSKTDKSIGLLPGTTTIYTNTDCVLFFSKL